MGAAPHRPRSGRAVSRKIVTLAQAVEQRPFLTLRHLRRLIFERRLPFYKAGGKVLVDLDEIDAWVESNRRPAVAS